MARTRKEATARTRKQGAGGEGAAVARAAAGTPGGRGSDDGDVISRFKGKLADPMRWLLLLGAAHACTCPYSKVEESFNMQAMYDLQRVWTDDTAEDNWLDSFDHHEFPGVVPRTFVGAVVVSLLSLPIRTVMMALLPALLPKEPQFKNEGFVSLLSVRLTLMMLTWAALLRLADALGQKFGRRARFWFGLVCVCQFHLAFYMGRSLPNTYALGLSALALARWLEGSWEECVGWLVFATVVFRCDTLILTGVVSLIILAKGEASFLSVFVDGVATGVSSLVLTVALDSFMWRRWVWPEGEVLFFNTVLNRSSEWGEMPPHWYFLHALPRALLASFPLVLLGPLQPLDRLGRALHIDMLSSPPPLKELCKTLADTLLDPEPLAYFFIPAVTYVSAYSLLPHKEVRFLFQVLPFFNALAAIAMVKLERVTDLDGTALEKKRRENGRDVEALPQRRLVAAGLFFFLGVLLFCSFFLAIIYLLVALRNYPGAVALKQVQQLYSDSDATSASVHYCVFAAMSGITRFLEHPSGFPGLEYSKREDPEFVATLCAKDFDYLITEVAYFQDRPGCAEAYDVVDTIPGNPSWSFWARRIHTDPVLYVLRKKPDQ